MIQQYQSRMLSTLSWSLRLVIIKLLCKVNINKNLAAPPKPKPPDPSELLLSKSKPPDPLSLELRQSKSWDFDQLATTLPRREPQPKPPDLSKSVDRERERW
ncbi:unnamed protein product [Trifolium pratense]|uniref:Uncharacterized protein n=1 Tax=Trifolium pratense TaxID=57577 RepID=A0ACB0MAB2_TRIPR|nr:unnamed protein product [Trifolium pratense]